jgi:hypothetical protein
MARDRLLNRAKATKMLAASLTFYPIMELVDQGFWITQDLACRRISRSAYLHIELALR